MPDQELYIGLMSGTSLDGVDAVLASFDENGRMQISAAVELAYSAALRQKVLRLQSVSTNELDDTARLSNILAETYASAVDKLIQQSGTNKQEVTAIACHGQTIRHAPQHGYSYQIGNLARLAELTNIDVIGDFRSRDIAAGGQGAPLVPAFHQDCFGVTDEARAILNIGGIANLTALIPNTPVYGFDTGPGNMLMDAWICLHQNVNYDQDGSWAASGTVQQDLLNTLMNDSYFALPPPKSTGRDLFHLDWLAEQLTRFSHISSPADVQATLLALTSNSICQAITSHLPCIKALYVCGGGAKNSHLMRDLQRLMPQLTINTTDQLGLPAQLVEASAFAWLGYRFTHRLTANLPEVTGAVGKRILGALYPA